ncbi:leucine-rich repeat domain-containing protein [Alkalinema sp. FACHB-956]|uniref:leucine-rich repeat domain-containing protein n=1 Tax=Alkalinema sp. FACHB-956 TaxID=2692768 RepID=UPI0016864C77|nr:leucine-rich repeat domain-containing protein [Alkalinema sp. FACHB-956]MBD2329804.1 leucine-rich repeat domain-containing protein [Alkalinema sp. FACHB-956]
MPNPTTPQELLRLIDRAADEQWEELDLSGMGLTELPKEIGRLTGLKRLVLGKVEKWERVGNHVLPTLVTNEITTLPAELTALENLQTLNLAGNPFGEIPEVVLRMSHLTVLELVSIGLTEIPEPIGQLTNLTQLSLFNNQIGVIPEVIGQLTNLTQLSLFNNQIGVIPEVIGQLTNLTQLDLSTNQIGVIPEVIGQLTNLTELYLYNNQIGVIPEVIGQLTNLTQLDLANNQIAVIPEVIGQLTNLTQLYLANNQIAVIPEVIGQLTNLTHLSLHNNQIAVIPEAIGQLTNLTHLYLYNNQIAVIPEVIGQLTNLTHLYLSTNQIAVIPEVIGQLTNLTQLSLSINQIAVIPEAIGQLTNLTWLSLSNNQIAVIPEVIGQLTNLTQLYLLNNQIGVIPEVIGQLSNLTDLVLSYNQIRAIPEVIGQLIQLESLSLRDNKIEAIPDCLQNLPQLKTLDLRRNRLPISPEILGPADLNEDPGSVEDIFNYLKQLRSGEYRPLNEAKVLLVGQGSVGKTSLLNRLMHDQYNPNESQTDGLAITRWNIEVNTKPIRLNVWDFGGQEIYHATHQFFLTKRSLYLLIANCRTSEEENRLDYWLQLIETFGDSAPVIIVGNKCDEQPLDINRKALREKYPNIKAILETSCATGQGILELSQAIHHEIAELREVYDLLPLSWFNLKQTLETLDQDFISLERYITLCAQNDITEEIDQDQLIRLLHNLGIVLNFRDHPILQTTSILNPHWVTSGIYALLSDDRLKTETKGILTRADLTRILDRHRYPPNRHHCLIELMQEFQLCFPLPDSPHHLIPAILPKEQPQNTDLPDDTLDFQYHYPILPDSIISRFIVLSHEKIHNQTYWRTGVLLQYCENGDPCNIARIKSDPADSKIFISISGREQTRRAFLTLIRDTFQRIHKSFANLEIGEYIPVPGHPDADPLDYQELLGLEDMGEQIKTIGKLKLRLNLRQLLDGYESMEQRQRRRIQERGDEDYRREYEDMREIAKLAVSRPIHNKAEAVAMNQESKYSNDLRNANIANFANEVRDNAQQNANQYIGTNTAELLQLIASLRQTAATFPSETKEEIEIDLEDLETELSKPPEQRNNTRIKKRLIALFTAATMIAGTVANVTDFTNTAIDLGQKLNLDLPALVGR